jgi:hypothetical protein
MRHRTLDKDLYVIKTHIDRFGVTNKPEKWLTIYISINHTGTSKD